MSWAGTLALPFFIGLREAQPVETPSGAVFELVGPALDDRVNIALWISSRAAYRSGLVMRLSARSALVAVPATGMAPKEFLEAAMPAMTAIQLVHFQHKSYPRKTAG